ncbi:MAG: DUF3795 domain-containing protein [Dehalococcoidia bacterium]|nr:DUF3795 domain-containing protein [Dehalococcoidia bacterium]MDD5494434.1 DUF3795 domain-containing protein [Dehalococcoidia bacterium]
MIAYCGLDCSACPAYLATQADDDKMRADCAQKWSEEYKSNVKPEQINCDGCKSDGRKFFVCKLCKVKKCAEEKGMENCSICADCVCDKLQEMMNIDPNIKKAVEARRQT